jgi:hypothetical protein
VRSWRGAQAYENSEPCPCSLYWIRTFCLFALLEAGRTRVGFDRVHFHASYHNSHDDVDWTADE